jgi:hypothetical protein
MIKKMEYANNRREESIISKLIKEAQVSYFCHKCGRNHRVNTKIWNEHSGLARIDVLGESIRNEYKKQKDHRFYILIKGKDGKEDKKWTFASYFLVRKDKDDFDVPMIKLGVPIESGYGRWVLSSPTEYVWFYNSEIVETDIPEVQALL